MDCAEWVAKKIKIRLFNDLDLNSNPNPCVNLKSYCHENEIYTQQKKKVDTFSTLIISYTNSIDGKCYHMIREIPPL